MALSVRFYFCQMVKSDWVLHVDDDMKFTEKTLNETLSEFAKNTKRIVGRHGRGRKGRISFQWMLFQGLYKGDGSDTDESHGYGEGHL